MAVAAGVSGCAGASWQKVQVSKSYQAPKQLKVALVTEASGENTAVAVQAMQAALADGLASKGIHATFIAAPTGESEANVTIAEWDPGSRALRYLIGFGAGTGSIIVRVKSPSAVGQGKLEGSAKGWVKGGFFGGSSDIAATEAGKLIAEAIATGKAEQD
jgi:hypothetical protein